MILNYRQQDNGMYVLSRNDIEHIATDLLREQFPTNLDYPIPLNTEALFESLGLRVLHKFLGIPGHEILGATVMGESEEIVSCDTLMKPIVIEETYGTVLINTELSCTKQAARRRYTEVHECSHWLLHLSYYDRLPQDGKSRLVACRSVESYKHERRTDADWREWQADTLAAALLMPRDVFYDYARSAIKDAGATRGYLIEGQSRDRSIFHDAVMPISRKFFVSQRAAQIRMIHLGLIKTASKYF